MTKHSLITPNSVPIPRGMIAARAEANPADPAEALKTLNEAFGTMKELTADRAKKVEDKMAAFETRFDDVVDKEQIEKISATMDAMQAAIDDANLKLKAMETQETTAGQKDRYRSPEHKAYAATFSKYMKAGKRDQEEALREANDKGGFYADYSVGTDADGGFTAPVEWDRTITDQIKLVSQMRNYASVQTVSGQGFDKIYNVHGTASGWVGEAAARPSTAGSQFAKFTFAFGEIYAMPAATQRILDDSEIDMESWIAEEVALEFAKAEGDAFVTGDGTNKPNGIMNFDAAGARGHPLGDIGEVEAASNTVMTDTDIIDLIYARDSSRTSGSAFYTTRPIMSLVRKLQDNDGNFIWQPSFQQGQPQLLAGWPLLELIGMDSLAASAKTMMFGNMAQTYRIFDRVGVRVLRDPYTDKPNITFYTTKRVGGDLYNPEWMTYLRHPA